MHFLGYLTNGEGYRPPPERVQCIIDYPKPDTIKDMRRFLGMITHYRQCNPNAAQLQAPLNDFLQGAKKNDKQKIQWTTKTEEAFVNYKNALATVTP